MAWLELLAALGKAPATLDAYRRALDAFLAFCAQEQQVPEHASFEFICRYLSHLRHRPNPRQAARAGLANATMQLHLSVIRLWYDYLIASGLRPHNPVPRGTLSSSQSAQRGLLPRLRTMPWIPTDSQWQAFLAEAASEPVRNRLMLAFAYCGALRREELVALRIEDVDPAHRLITVRAESSKTRRTRVVGYTAEVDRLYAGYLYERRLLSRRPGPLFLSCSNRNRGAPLSTWSWTKIVERMAQRAKLERLTTHTLRHLRLTHLARQGWTLHEIATYAGHQNISTTLIYVHLSGRELGLKLAQTTAALDARLACLGP